MYVVAIHLMLFLGSLSQLSDSTVTQNTTTDDPMLKAERSVVTRDDAYNEVSFI